MSSNQRETYIKGGMMTPEILLRYLAIIFLFLIVIGSCVLVGYEILVGKPLSPYAFTIIGSALGYALSASGVEHGANISATATTTTMQEIQKGQSS